ncbi:hypothetical protein MTX78_15115 [Hymenobacter tibetensis]|uniref:Uncharacterized protein n=1 Tax=Hymenobacter tibetensis TaxID=497967 RepID=A0ABY4CWT1_9BACT|nr:hypothetical protein [Hymenobacter tibetensis]UOG73454.1 hypothetical protein MTX78_15115 [Hymenobacter tibetensis]
MSSFTNMMEQFSALYPTGTIRYSQTTYLELATAVEVHRIDFHHKVAAILKRGTGGQVGYYCDHPALVYYNASLAALTVRASLGLPSGFLAAFYHRFATLTADWNAFLPVWSGIERNQQWLEERLRNGHRHTLYLPLWVANELQALCWVYGVEASYLKREELLQSRYYFPKPLQSPPPFNLLLIGQNYVIARDFYVSTLR